MCRLCWSELNRLLKNVSWESAQRFTDGTPVTRSSTGCSGACSLGERDGICSDDYGFCGRLAWNSGFTDSRINTTIVNTPRTVPNGINMHSIPATTKQ